MLQSLIIRCSLIFVGVVLGLMVLFNITLEEVKHVELNIKNPHTLLEQAMKGIAYVETGRDQLRDPKFNPYTAKAKPSRNGDRAYGKYQIMGANIKSWSKEALGKSLSIDEYLSNPELQEQIAAFQINQILHQYDNLDDTFSVWFSGRPVKKAGNATDAYGTSVPVYIKVARKGAGL